MLDDLSKHLSGAAVILRCKKSALALSPTCWFLSCLLCRLIVHDFCFSPHQSLHFFYGLGALVSPVIAEPFLRSACTDGHFQSNIFGWTLENSTLEGLMEEYSIDGLQVNMTALNETMSQVSRHYHTKSFVQYAYWLIALLQVSVPVFLSVCLSIACGCLFRTIITKISPSVL